MSEETLRRDENSERFLREPVFVNQKAVHDLVDDGRTQPINLLRQEVKDRFGVLPRTADCLGPVRPVKTLIQLNRSRHAVGRLYLTKHGNHSWGMGRVRCDITPGTGQNHYVVRSVA